MATSNSAEGPLAGIRVLDLSVVISGPLATMILGDQGAEVIKVESPGQGDPMRVFGAIRGGMASTFMMVNRSKRGIVLDLKHDEGTEVFRDLVRWADVLVQNFRPGVMKRLGFDYADCRKLNEPLIYVSLSGFGPEGPYADRRVYDYVIQAISGMAAIQADPQTGRPELVRNFLLDKATAYSASQAITAALFARERGKGGQHIQLAMLDAALAFLWPDGMMRHTLLGDGAQVPQPLGKAYSVWDTRDGVMTLGTLLDGEWRGICLALERPDLLEDPRFSTTMARMANLGEMREALAEIIVTRTTQEWCDHFERHDVPHAPIVPLEEVHNDPQVRANRILEETEHPAAGPFRQPLPATKFSLTPAVPQGHAPLHGQHTDEILAELGYDQARIAALRLAGAVE